VARKGDLAIMALVAVASERKAQRSIWWFFGPGQNPAQETSSNEKDSKNDGTGVVRAL
jgi:hypothetical protein